MNIINTDIPDLLIIEPKVFGDDRGFFFESYNERTWREATGLSTHFVQDNHSRSMKNVLRGLHYQLRQPQGKLVRVVVGEVFDVAVDIRRGSPTFGKWAGVRLSARTSASCGSRRGLPTASSSCPRRRSFSTRPPISMLRSTSAPSLWNDPDLAIDWPLDGEPILSAKDAAAPRFREADFGEP